MYQQAAPLEICVTTPTSHPHPFKKQTNKRKKKKKKLRKQRLTNQPYLWLTKYHIYVCVCIHYISLRSLTVSFQRRVVINHQSEIFTTNQVYLFFIINWNSVLLFQVQYYLFDQVYKISISYQ